MKRTSAFLLFVFLATTNTTQAANDPSIVGKTREGVQKAMHQHIVKNTLDKHYIIFDGQTGDLKYLTFEARTPRRPAQTQT